MIAPWLLMASGIVTGQTASARTPGSQVLYCTGSSGDVHVILDPRTTERISGGFSSPVTGFRQGLTWKSGKLWSVHTSLVIHRDWLLAINPADYSPERTGLTGLSADTAILSLEANTANDGLYMLIGKNYGGSIGIYRIDEKTGVASFVTGFGHAPGFFGPDTMAINNQGRFILTHSPTIDQPVSLWDFDPATGLVNLIGHVPIGLGYFQDTAFDAQGKLWGAFVNLSTKARSGLYRINLDTLDFEFMFQAPWDGNFVPSIAFVPVPETTVYCAAKPSAEACEPSIDGKGFPSSTATKGFTVRARGVPSGAQGMLLFGTGRQASIPFAGGTLCIGGDLARSPPVAAGGSSPPVYDCTGLWEVDLNMILHSQAPIPAGMRLRCQWIGIDPSTGAHADVILSDALEVELIP